MTSSCKWPIELYYINTRGGGGALINTNEIRGELSRENMISSHVKITRYLHHPTRRQHLRSKRSPLLWLHNKSRLSQLKNVYIYTYEKVKWFGILSGVYIIFKVEQHMAP